MFDRIAMLHYRGACNFRQDLSRVRSEPHRGSRHRLNQLRIVALQRACVKTR